MLVADFEEEGSGVSVALEGRCNHHQGDARVGRESFVITPQGGGLADFTLMSLGPGLVLLGFT